MNTYQRFYSIPLIEGTSYMLKLVQIAFEILYVFIYLSVSRYMSVNIYDYDFVYVCIRYRYKIRYFNKEILRFVVIYRTITGFPSGQW